MKTAEEIAEPFVSALMADGKAASIHRWVLAQTITNAVKEALREHMLSDEVQRVYETGRAVERKLSAPTFKVENLNRDARYLTAAARLISDAAHLREISYAGHPSIKEKIAEARRILATLSSEDVDQ